MTELYNPFVLKEVEVLKGHPTSWVDYVNMLIDGNHIPAHEVVVIKNPKYLKKLAPLMQSTNIRTISNYLMWRALMYHMSDMNREAGEIREKFIKEVSGINSDPPRWKKCTKEVGFNNMADNNLRVVASSMYIEKYFVPEAKVEMLDMIGNLKSAFKKILEDIDWMDTNTKSQAFNKLQVMNEFIAYPDELTHEDIVAEYHSGLSINEEDFYGNKLRLNKWNKILKQSRLREKVDKTDWRDHSVVPVINAFYKPKANAMVFPAGILQGVFFNHKVIFMVASYIIITY